MALSSHGTLCMIAATVAIIIFLTLLRMTEFHFPMRMIQLYISKCTNKHNATHSHNRRKFQWSGTECQNNRSTLKWLDVFLYTCVCCTIYRAQTPGNFPKLHTTVLSTLLLFHSIWLGIVCVMYGMRFAKQTSYQCICTQNVLFRSNSLHKYRNGKKETPYIWKFYTDFDISCT